MTETLGKRIAEHRKRLKMTQDQLAEKLGLTAQAVSKWENDQSCPDITMLPRLAAIFGVTTDALLGMEQEKPALEAEVVDDRGVHFDLDTDKSGKWEFHWDAGKRGSLAFAMLVLTVGLLFFAARWLNWDVSFWGILWPCSILVFGIQGLVEKFSAFSVGATLFGGYFLVKNLGFWEFDLAGELIFPIAVVLFGVSLLLDAMNKPNKSRFRVTHNGDTVHEGATQNDYTVDDAHFECSSSFGDATRTVELPRLESGEINCSFGDLTVDLTPCGEFAEDCSIEADCSFGQLTLMVPKRCRVVADTSSAFADFTMKGHPDPDADRIICLSADVSFGHIAVHYI